MKEYASQESLYVLFSLDESSIWFCRKKSGYQASEVKLSKEASIVVTLAGQIAARETLQSSGVSPVSSEHLKLALKKIDRVETILKRDPISLLKRWVDRRPTGLIKNDHRRRNPAGPDFNGSGMVKFWGAVALIAQSQGADVDVNILRTVLGVLK